MKFEGMTDEEILDNVLEIFEDDGRLNLDYIDLDVVERTLNVTGRVSTEEEQQILDEILTGLGIDDYKNSVWVDESLAYEDRDDDDTNIKTLNFDDDDEIDDPDYSGEDDDDKDDM